DLNTRPGQAVDTLLGGDGQATPPLQSYVPGAPPGQTHGDLQAEAILRPRDEVGPVRHDRDRRVDLDRRLQPRRGCRDVWGRLFRQPPPEARHITRVTAQGDLIFGAVLPQLVLKRTQVGVAGPRRKIDRRAAQRGVFAGDDAAESPQGALGRAERVVEALDRLGTRGHEPHPWRRRALPTGQRLHQMQDAHTAEPLRLLEGSETSFRGVRRIEAPQVDDAAPGTAARIPRLREQPTEVFRPRGVDAVAPVARPAESWPANTVPARSPRSAKGQARLPP